MCSSDLYRCSGRLKNVSDRREFTANFGLDLKHHGKEDDEVLTINLFDEAYWMIKRSLTNAKRLEIRIKNQLDFENWIVININM